MATNNPENNRPAATSRIMTSTCSYSMSYIVAWPLTSSTCIAYSFASHIGNLHEELQSRSININEVISFNFQSIGPGKSTISAPRPLRTHMPVTLVVYTKSSRTGASTSMVLAGTRYGRRWRGLLRPHYIAWPATRLRKTGVGARKLSSATIGLPEIPSLPIIDMRIIQSLGHYGLTQQKNLEPARKTRSSSCRSR